MKSNLIFTFMILLLFFVSCDSEDKYEVEEFIASLEEDTYLKRDLPALSAHDIPYLLKYSDDQTEVIIFPFSPISSYADPNAQYRLGVLALWTIESIRVVSIDSKFLIQRFPSQNPFVQLKDEPYTWFTDHDDAVYQTIRDAYKTWWENIKSNDFESFHHIDPLEKTNYRWH